ncbi:MAG: alpha-mannosidase [Verrucomicrobia bacterium]|nr:MAG: alpha-mannosidase [Verrucomicrobiota bacterium]
MTREPNSTLQPIAIIPMLKHLSITSARIKNLADSLQLSFYSEEQSLSPKVFSTSERLPFAKAIKGRFRKTAEGESFGPRWSSHWFRIDLTVPNSWRGREVHLRFHSSSEALIWSEDGKPLQGLVAANWAGPTGGPEEIRSHHVITRKAKGGETAVFYVEAAITGLMGFGMTDTAPEKTDPGFVGQLKLCRIACFDREKWDLYHDLRTLGELSRQLPDSHHLRMRAITAGNAMANVLEMDDRQTWPQARAIAADFFTKNQGARRFQVSAIGHAHIDTAWLWTIAETIRKCARSFVSQLRIAEQYPEHKFACSQAQQLAWVKHHYPSLFAEIGKAAKAGSFIPCGGAWIEPDCNLPSGESLIRQFLLGQRFYEREFGHRCREFWNPDVFGYSAAMPQILKGVGIDFFLTQKLSWSQFNRPVSTTFMWEGLDGTAILTHFPPADTYNGTCEPAELLRAMDNHKDLERSNEGIYLFGFGDGGGGPTSEMLEKLRRCASLDGMPQVAIRGVSEFFERLEKDTQDPLRWVGELYLELHRGTYTTQAANKRDNRRSEEALHDAEFLAALAYLAMGHAYPHEKITKAWELTCLNQFHDIIPGSSIHEVYQDSARDYAEIFSLTQSVRDEASSALYPKSKAKGKNITALNTLSWDRREVLDLAGGPRIFTAPAMGHEVQAASGAQPHIPVSVARSGKLWVLENGIIRAKIDAAGELVSFVDLASDRECIAASTTGNRLVLHDDLPLDWEAWDIEIYHLEKAESCVAAEPGSIILDDPRMAKIQFTRKVGKKSTLVQTIIMRAESNVLEFSNQCDWQESRKLLKVEFPLDVRSEFATYEVQFGHVRRPTHFNTSWDWARFEVCGHRWADLSEPDFGVALINDSKYGYSCHSHVLKLSLLRSPTAPDPYADRGQHHFRYGLMPHQGGPQAGGVVRAAAQFNQPLQCLPSSQPCDESISYFRVSHPAVIVDTVKKAEDSEHLIVRLYESHGTRVKAELQSDWKILTAHVTNMLEDLQQPLEITDHGIPISMRPFEILTLRLKMRPTAK